MGHVSGQSCLAPGERSVGYITTNGLQRLTDNSVFPLPVQKVKGAKTGCDVTDSDSGERGQATGGCFLGAASSVPSFGL